MVKQWWHRPLVIVANLPLIILALRWNWLNGVRLAGMVPAKFTFDSEMMWLLFGAACFALNVWNLLVGFHQDEEIVNRAHYRTALYCFAGVLVVGLVVCWTKPDQLIVPQKLTWLPFIAACLLTGQALAGNYLLTATTDGDDHLKLTWPTLTWLATALLTWVSNAAKTFDAVAVLIVVILLAGNAVNLKILLTGNGTVRHPAYQLATGASLAAWLGLATILLSWCWCLLTGRWAGLLDFVMVVDLMIIAAASQLATVLDLREVHGVQAEHGHLLLLSGAILAVLIELITAGVLTMLAMK